jgi:hypothetical protein
MVKLDIKENLTTVGYISMVNVCIGDQLAEIAVKEISAAAFETLFRMFVSENKIHYVLYISIQLV